MELVSAIQLLGHLSLLEVIQTYRTALHLVGLFAHPRTYLLSLLLTKLFHCRNFVVPDGPVPNSILHVE